VNISPGILGTYWALGSFTLTAAWIAACKTTRRATRREARR
jgi:hypothetical protein